MQILNAVQCCIMKRMEVKLERERERERDGILFQYRDTSLGHNTLRDYYIQIIQTNVT